MKNKSIAIDNKLRRYKKGFFTLLIILIIFILVNSIYLYLNYDYLAFKHFISQNYIYTEALDSLYKDELKINVDSKYYKYFDNMVISVITKRIQEINKDPYTYLYRPEQLIKYKEEEKQEALNSKLEVLNNTTAYIHVTNFSTYTKHFLEKNIATIKEYPNLIIDLRDNYGGDVFAMNAMASFFLPKGSIISIDKMRLFSKTFTAKKTKVLTKNNIVILQNKNTASASESFIAALKGNLKNVVLVGDTTFGKGIGQFTLPLKRGFAVKATTMLWFTPEKINIQGEGIKPDISYNHNDIIEFVLNKLF
jgi:C-terminal processing protease CtpA/Prc